MFNIILFCCGFDLLFKISQIFFWRCFNIKQELPINEQITEKEVQIIDENGQKLGVFSIEEALEKAGVTLDNIDAISVTHGPGLVGALLVGVSYAKGLSFATGKPLVPVNHIEGHIAANYITYKDLKPPFITLIVSGGHTHLVEVKDYTKMKIIS